MPSEARLKIFSKNEHKITNFEKNFLSLCVQNLQNSGIFVKK